MNIHSISKNATRNFLKLIPSLLFLAGSAMAGQWCHGQDGPVEMPSSEMHILRSEQMDRVFRIYVQLPLDYDPGRPGGYPVMYVTDGNRSFPMVANISTLLGFPPAGFPPLILVGIAYDIGSMADWAAWRTHDLTPTASPGTEAYWEKLIGRLTGDTSIVVRTGGAGEFLDFIAGELVPFMEDTYPVSATDRTLAGYSYGGLFTLFAFFERPGLFNRYLAGSPSLQYDDGVIFRMEATFASGMPDPRATLFLSAGELEGEEVVARVRKLENLLGSRPYPHLKVHTYIVEGENHRSAYPGTFTRGFQVLYEQERPGP